MADGTLFERRGIPAACICTEAFTASGSAMATVQGYRDYRYALIPHPMSSLTHEECKERASAVLPEVLQILGIGIEGA
ncbi:MAG: hypothetical protein KGJ86_15195 [Chloroflexota bacterium]|nr:hypothetical protein [Chloroflexota bacterium]